MELNQEWIDAHVGPDSPKLLHALMHRKTQLVDPRKLATPDGPTSDRAPGEVSEPAG